MAAYAGFFEPVQGAGADPGADEVIDGTAFQHFYALHCSGEPGGGRERPQDPAVFHKIDLKMIRPLEQGAVHIFAADGDSIAF